MADAINNPCTEKNRMIVRSKILDEDGNLKDKCETVFPLADDSTEVRGFGMPLSPEVAREAVNSFCNSFEQASKFISDFKFPNNLGAEETKGLDALKKLLNPDKFIVSGVFGKEIILQVLAQKNCEGIRYCFCRVNGELSILLMGVRDTGEMEIKTGKVKSEPLFADVINGTNRPQSGDSDTPVIPEVRVNGLKFNELREIVNREHEALPNFSKAVFSAF